jgi:hypothetical protein
LTKKEIHKKTCLGPLRGDFVVVVVVYLEKTFVEYERKKKTYRLGLET